MKQCPKCALILPEVAFHKGGKQRKNTGYCKKCRSLQYFYKKYKNFCIKCEEPGKILANQICKTCNKEMGLKECSKCKRVFELIDFYKNRYECKECSILKRIANQTD